METFGLLLLIALAAALYSSVGQGGGSGYIAAMALIGLAPEVMKPSALAMNVAVTLFSLWLIRDWKLIPSRLFWPLVLPSIPAAVLGGYYLPTSHVYAYLVAGALIVAGVTLCRGQAQQAGTKKPSITLLIPIGAILGLVSGLSGVGGGIFLSPILLFAGWAELRVVMAISSAFILLNSAAALVGFGISGLAWPSELPAMLVAALAGATLGTYFGRRYLSTAALRRILGVVLLFAALRMLLSSH